MAHTVVPFDTNSLSSHIRYEYRNGRPALISPHGRNYLDHNDLTTNHTGIQLKSSAMVKTTSQSLGYPIFTTTSAITNINSDKALQHLQLSSTLLLLMKIWRMKVDKKDAENIIIKEWRMIAIVMDRIFFICYLIIHLCAAFGLLIPRSSEYDVVEFLREYRLKNYNSTFFENETITVNNYQTITTIPPNVNTMIDTIQTDKQSHYSDTRASISLDMNNNEKTKIQGFDSPLPYERKPIYDSSNSLDSMTSFLSPYQRLVDQQANAFRTSENNGDAVLVYRKPDQIKNELKKRNQNNEWKNLDLT
ncbi:hypothetical protein MN116_001617 [Schistosoma mekongi]|uniref:Uncharacterized protein n=1 Tax=Schistosoma mekongi TaxID=38744 RepID=A0AAE1ZIF7_SCHME|nr:hypothetical protein MN116_001617 [Schistosoma mekongi]